MSNGNGKDLVVRFVDQVLNGHQRDVVDGLFHVGYKDFDPIRIPGYEPRPIQNKEYVHALCVFLATPEIDIHFTIEDLFGEEDRVAYRLFGEGLLPAEVQNENGSPPQSQHEAPVGGIIRNRRIGTFAVLTRDQRDQLSRSGKIVGSRLHVEYRSVGFFLIKDSLLFQRYGMILTR